MLVCLANRLINVGCVFDFFTSAARRARSLSSIAKTAGFGRGGGGGGSGDAAAPLDTGGGGGGGGGLVLAT